jgi:hypothetical protein
VVSHPSEQPPIALGVWSPGEAVGYPSQYPHQLRLVCSWLGRSRGLGCTRKVDFLDVASLPVQPALELADGHVVGNSSFP